LGVFLALFMEMQRLERLAEEKRAAHEGRM
jgi:hypothetical protein